MPVTWYKIAESLQEIDFSENWLATVEVNSKKICVAIHNSTLYACTQKCPHAGGVMAEGYIDAVGNIVCPAHRYKFSLQTGRNSSGEGYFLKTFPVQIRDNGIFIGMGTVNPFGGIK